MKLGEKIRYLREVEGALRGFDRAMTQQEVVRAIKKDLKKPISQSYLSQIESGARPHLTNTSRMLLAKFFKVHPGYLVDDPEGYSTELISDFGALEDKLDLWLVDGAERFRNDPDLRESLLCSRQTSRFPALPAAAATDSGKPGPRGPALRRADSRRARRFRTKEKP